MNDRKKKEVKWSKNNEWHTVKSHNACSQNGGNKNLERLSTFSD